MDQRIGPALAVNRRATTRLEPEPCVEPSCLYILLVDVGGEVRVTPERALHESTAYSATMILRVDKQGLQVTVLDQHEPNRPIGLIHGEIQGFPRKKRSHFCLDIAPVPGLQELMGGIHSTAPDFHDPWALCRQ